MSKPANNNESPPLSPGRRDAEKTVRRKARWRKWHSWSGLVSLLLVANLIFTGILLNHSAELKLAQRYVTWGYLLDWYGFQPIERAARFVARPGTFTQLQERLYLNDRYLFDLQPLLSGVCELADYTSLVTPYSVTLVNGEGEKLETVELPPSLQGEPNRTGCGSQGVVIEKGTTRYVADELLMNWAELASDVPVSWAAPTLLEGDEWDRAYRLYHGRSLSWEKLLQDLHSGRLFGLPGVIAMDLAALLLLVQLISGVYLYLKSPLLSKR